MADTDDTSPEFVADVLRRAFIPEGFWIEMGVVAVIAYEYLLTIRIESKVIWRRKLTIPTGLYLFNRYALVLFAVATSLWAFVSWQSPTISMQASYTAFSALRIHAINNHNWPITILILCLGAVALPQSVAAILASRRLLVVPPPLSGCAVAVWSWDGLNESAWSRVQIAAEVSIILMDIVVLVVTWYRTAGIIMLARKAQLATSLARQMLRDGTTFFSLALGLHIIVIVVDETRQTSLVLVTTTFMSIIMTRFILNLRMLHSTDMETKLQSLHVTRFTSIRFSSPAFDNIGAPLDVDGENERNHDDDLYGDDDETVSLHQELIPRGVQNQMGEYSSVLDMELMEE
ncbi:hypothetical protein BC628DRAFT_1336827 [Trametes gibbosa]|nr:hypothetical protein BC628DRAFT_1336827 [Trametes gibbosa]